MIRLVTIVCAACGRPHCATIKALTRRPACPFCGERVRQAAIAATPPDRRAA